MNRLLSAWLALLMLSWATVCGAAVSQRDWKTPGDGLLTFDDAHKREWLDLSESLLSQFPGATLESRYQNALAELGPAGRFAGFTVAKRVDVTSLALSAGIDVATNDFAANQAATSMLIELLSPTATVSSGIIWSIGSLDEFSAAPPQGVPQRLDAMLTFDPPRPFLLGSAGLSFPHGDFDAPAPWQFIGVMLYREIPEPSTLVCALVGFAAIYFKNRIVSGLRAI